MAKRTTKGLEEILGKEKFVANVGGRKLTLGPLRASELAEFRAWVKEQKIHLLLRIADKVNPAILNEQIDRIFSMQSTVELDDNGKVLSVDDPILSEITTENGLRYILFLAARRHHPHLAFKDVDFALNEMAELTVLLPRLIGLGDEEEEEGKEEERPTEAKEEEKEEEAPAI